MCVCVSSLIHTYIATYILIYISVGVGDLFCLPLGFAAIEFHWAAPCAVINLIWVICMTFGRVDPLASPPLPHSLAYPTAAQLSLFSCPYSCPFAPTPSLARLVHFLLFASSITLFALARAD